MTTSGARGCTISPTSAIVSVMIPATGDLPGADPLDDHLAVRVLADQGLAATAVSGTGQRGGFLPRVLAGTGGMGPLPAPRGGAGGRLPARFRSVR